jgi:hypothetical protein
VIDLRKGNPIMKKTALMLALMTFAGAAMAEGGCHADYNRCQPSQAVQSAAPAPIANVAASDSAASNNVPGDAWARLNQQSVPTHSSR